MRRLFPVFGLIVLLLECSPGEAAVPAGVDKAVERGVAALKAMQRGDGTWPHGEIGATALAGLALLECGVPANDPAMQKAADAVRRASLDLTHTYSLALNILFLDRLGEPVDVALVESMTVRLLAGQNANGGWTYQCPSLPDTEVRRLTNLLNHRNELVAGPRPAGAARRSVGDLAPEIQQQLKLISQQAATARPGKSVDDNSNTQFATLALWVARRHGLPTDAAIAKLNLRFRSSQNADGGWGYRFPVGSVGKRPTDKSTATMTCAGLLGLAVAYGAARDATLKTDPKQKEPARPAQPLPDPTRDNAVRAGLLALGTAVGHPVGNAKGGFVPGIDKNGRMYYYLWSLERVAVAYGLPTIGGKDWYAWGAEILIANQEAGGTWDGAYSHCGADTCFALLFLERANLAHDLTASLKGSVADPGEATLKAGGLGGSDLAGKSKLDLSDDDASAETVRPPVEVKPPPTPAQNVDAEATRLGRELVNASADRQLVLLKGLRDNKGAAFTQALANAIPALTGEVKTKARDALAERLTRMTAATLLDKLQDDDVEVRRAAALAVALKEDASFVPQLIDMLTDPQPFVSRAALAALKSLTKQDLGPDPAAWKAWANRLPKR